MYNDNNKNEFKKGDRVYHPGYGFGTITEIKKNNTLDYPIVVLFDHTDPTYPIRFTSRGRYYASDLKPSLVKTTSEGEYPRKVMVKNKNDREWEIRILVGMVMGKPACSTSLEYTPDLLTNNPTLYVWDEYKEIENDITTMTIKEIEDKLYLKNGSLRIKDK